MGFPVGMTRVVALARARRLGVTGQAERIRKATGRSAREIGAAVGASHVAVLRWERGERMPRSDAAIRWAALMDELASEVARP